MQFLNDESFAGVVRTRQGLRRPDPVHFSQDRCIPIVDLHAARLALVINSLLALLTSGVSLVVLLIAPLGLASVITLTLLIGLCSFAGGLAGDAALLWALPGSRNRGTERQRSGAASNRRLPARGLPPQR